MRRERGFGVNPWMTHSRFLVSHNLLIDPSYADPMRTWLGAMRPGSLLILDEAHHAAPSSGGRYGIESGVKVRGRKALEDVMVRRLKEDIRATQGGFPERRVEGVVIDGLPPDAAALVPLAKAREQALANRILARSGGDPLSEKRRVQGVPTFAEAARLVLEQKHGG